MAYAQTPRVIGPYDDVIDIDETVTVLEKTSESADPVNLNMLITKNTCTNWQVRTERRTRIVTRCSSPRVNPRGPGYPGPRGPRGGSPGRVRPAPTQCRQVIVPYYVDVNYCASSSVSYQKQLVNLEFVNIANEAKVVLSISEDINGEQTLNSTVDGLRKSDCLKSTTFSKTGGMISKINVRGKTKRRCRGI